MRQLTCWVIAGSLVACSESAVSLPDVGSKPVPPSAQGASNVTLQPVSPASADQTCPVGNIATSPIPPVAAASEMLDSRGFQHFIVDGEEGAAVSCSVAGQTNVVFTGSLSQSGRTFEVSEGSFPSNKRIGKARIAITDAQLLPARLQSNDFCTVDASDSPDDSLQVKEGAMWAHFNCPSLEAEPSDACAASGYFVLENCGR